MKILVTGGAGYIGSHTSIELLENGHDVIIVDNLYNSKPEAVKRVEALGGKKVPFYQTDILDTQGLKEIFEKNRVDAVIHFAGLKAVGESVDLPLRYYKNNVAGTVALCEVMKEFNVRNIVFSSSATVYGTPHSVPISEDFPLSALNPYGRSKLVVEEILRDLYASDRSWNIAILRYFNPVGAHKSGDIGEDPNGIPNNLFPFISQVAVGKLKKLSVFGNDYPTKDGTGVRDYIHVLDLATGHLKALLKLSTNPGIVTCNLGTGKGYSVLEIISAFQSVTGREIPYEIVARRAGDVGACYADPSKAKADLGWTAEKNIVDMCKDAWNWQSKNPDGFVA